MKLLCMLLCCCMLFSGCETAVTSETAAIPGNIAEFEFSLPAGYIFEEDKTNSLNILKNSEIIGGLVLTGLDTSCLEDTGNADVHRYVNSYGPVPMICEYIIMQGGDFLSVSMAVTDPETDIRTETSHRLFAREGHCFDFWVKRETVSDKERAVILKSICESE